MAKNFDQRGQTNTGWQQNAAGDITNIFPPKPWVPPMMLPPRAQSFVGRKEELAWLLDQLLLDPVARGRIIALCGPGGIGKTALIAEALTHITKRGDFRTRFPDGIFYHSFYAYPLPEIAYEDLARIFEENPGPDPYRAPIRALSRRQALLIFDGLEVLSDDHIAPLRYLGGTNVVLLLSRRHTDAAKIALKRTLTLLSLTEGQSLLQQIAGTYALNHRSIEQLLQHIKGFPLALQIIGSYLSSYQEDVTEYLQWFEQEGLVALDHGNHHEDSIPILLQRTYTTLSSQQQQVFTLFGLLAPAPFPIVLIRKILELPEQAVRHILGSLVNLSILSRLNQNPNYEVSHPLVHTFASERLAPQEQTSSITIWRERLLTTLTMYFKQNKSYDRDDLTIWQPHVSFLLFTTYLTEDQSLRASHLFNTVGCHAQIQGKYAEAEPLLQRSLAISEQLMGPLNSATAISLNNLAELYQAQGKYADADALLQRALTIDEQQLGPRHSDTATSLNNLAGLYQAQGKYTKAESFYKRALDIWAQQLGPLHPNTATSLNNLAEIYLAQGKAEPLYQRALSIREQQFGPTHPDTANSLNNLAGLYQALGKYTKAESFYKRALDIWTQLLGPLHPDTATSLNNLAEILGPNHPSTKKIRGSLSSLASRPTN